MRYKAIYDTVTLLDQIEDTVQNLAEVIIYRPEDREELTDYMVTLDRIKAGLISDCYFLSEELLEANKPEEVDHERTVNEGEAMNMQHGKVASAATLATSETH